MFKKIAKWVGLIALILLLGQINVGRNTLAGHFANATQNTLYWGAGEFRKTSLYSAMLRWPVVGKWLDSGTPKPVKKKVAMKTEAPKESPKVVSQRNESISTSDRESLMRLLQ